MSHLLSDTEVCDTVQTSHVRSVTKRFAYGLRCLRKVRGINTLNPLRDVWAMRSLRMDAAISSPPMQTRYVCFSVRHGAFATSVYVDADACIVWRYPEAAEWAWGAIGNATLCSILRAERWHDFIPGPADWWDEVRLEEIGPVPNDVGMMLEVVHRDARFFFKQANRSLGLTGDAPLYHETVFLQTCPVATTVVMGNTRIPLDVLCSLRAGDVVKITALTPLLRVSPNMAFPLSLDQGVLIVTDLPSSHLTQASHIPGVSPVAHSVDDHSPPDEPSPTWLGELPVELSFAFEPIVLTVAELSALRPGDVVPLESGVRLLIHANNRLVGEAELVEVEGELAAEVVAIHLRSKT